MLNFLKQVFCSCCFILGDMIPGEGSVQFHRGVLRDIQAAEKRARVLPESLPCEPKMGIFSWQMLRSSACFSEPLAPNQAAEFQE
jgi:hypothetical protein